MAAALGLLAWLQSHSLIVSQRKQQVCIQAEHWHCSPIVAYVRWQTGPLPRKPWFLKGVCGCTWELWLISQSSTSYNPTRLEGSREANPSRVHAHYKYNLMDLRTRSSKMYVWHPHGWTRPPQHLAAPMWSARVSTLVARSTLTALTAYSRSPVMNWRLAQSVPCLRLTSAGIGSSPPRPHVWMEYLGGWRNSLNTIEVNCGEDHHCSK